MAGPVPTYLSTQLAAQTAFNVPFGLLTLVNTAITTATAAGEFNTTVDCSLFTDVDVSNLRIYLDSLGYFVEYAKGNSKGLLVDWSRFLDIPGTEVIADQGAPNTLANGWPVKITDGSVVLGTVLNPLVVTDEGITGIAVNVWAEASALPTIETTIISYTVPIGKVLSILEIIGWGTYDGEFLVRVNGTIKGGGRTSAAQRTLDIDYSDAPISANAGDIVHLTIQDYSPNTETFRANLLGRLN